MGNADSIPLISQAKSLVQVISGDADGARRTQENFVDTCPVVSQTKSLVQVCSGDADGARRTQEKFGQGMSDMADGIPVVGHIKGGIHYACGDSDGGDKAMKASSRTVGVIGGGIGGFVVSGPAGAAAGGILGGQAVDGITTGIDSAVHQEYRPNGTLIGGITTCVEKGDNTMSGDIFDMAFGTTMDGVTGYSAGKGVNSAARAIKDKHWMKGYKKGGVKGYVNALIENCQTDITTIQKVKYAVREAWIGEMPLLQAILKKSGKQFLIAVSNSSQLVDLYTFAREMREISE